MTNKKTILFGLAFLACVAVVALWQLRVAMVTRAVRGALDRHGLADVAFTLRQLTPGHVVVDDVRLGMPLPVLAIDQVDVRFSCLELLSGHVERVTVRGVRTRLAMDGGRLTSPVYERIKPLLAADAAREDTRPLKAKKANFSLGVGLLQDVRVGIIQGGGVLATLTLEAGALSEASGRYRAWGNVSDGAGLQLRAECLVEPGAGAVTLTPELKIKSVEKLVDLACRAAPELTARMPAFPTNCALTVRGAVAVQGWTNVGPFEVSAELGRGSALVVPGKDALVRFQSFRLEASGTPRDMQCRVSAGVAGFKVGGQFLASQEEGRILGLRGTARFRQTETNQWVTAALDSDLPGRSMAQVLPYYLPLMRVFFSEGGTLHVEADVTRLPQARWNGAASFKAEALRSSVPLTAGRVGAGAMRVAGTVAIVDEKPDAVRTEIKLEDGYYLKRDLSVAGGLEMTLTCLPPYASATGVFKGRVSESVALPQRNLVFNDGAVPFEGEARVTGLTSQPVWRLALRVPEFGVASGLDGPAGNRVSATTARASGRPAQARPGAGSGAEVSDLAWHATAGASATVRYSVTSLALEGDAWVRDVTVLAGPASNRMAEAGVGRITARVEVPSFNPALASNALVGVTLNMSNGWARAGTLAVLEDAGGAVPLSWSLAKGVSFLPEPRLTWQRLEAQGLKVEPDALALSVTGTAVEVRFGAHVAGSKVGVALKASVPWDDPHQAVIDVTLPEAEIAADDVLAGLVREKANGVEFSGRVSAEAQVLFWGTHPRIVGRARLADGQVRKDQLSVEGLSADVPFQKGISFRTMERPVVSFTRAKAGNVKLDQGRLSFQLTQKELFVDRMEVGWCKGSLNAYSVHLDLKSPKDDFVVYADRIDLGEALMMVLPFKGMMQGVLYGRFPVGFDKGHVKLSTGFLYSLPGQGGKLKLEDHAQMAALLDKAGITGDVQVPLSKALSDMDFSTFKMDLEPGQSDQGTLRIKLGGQSNDAAWPAPVDLTLNLHGPLEELLNMGLKMKR